MQAEFSGEPEFRDFTLSLTPAQKLQLLSLRQFVLVFNPSCAVFKLQSAVKKGRVTSLALGGEAKNHPRKHLCGPSQRVVVFLGTPAWVNTNPITGLILL